jgi:hypothetical protein
LSAARTIAGAAANAVALTSSVRRFMLRLLFGSLLA